MNTKENNMEGSYIINVTHIHTLNHTHTRQYIYIYVILTLTTKYTFFTDVFVPFAPLVISTQAITSLVPSELGGDRLTKKSPALTNLFVRSQ